MQRLEMPFLFHLPDVVGFEQLLEVMILLFINIASSDKGLAIFVEGKLLYYM